MERKEGVLVFIVENNRVLFCKEKKSKFWSGIFAENLFCGHEDLARKTAQFLSQNFGVFPGKMTQKGVIYKEFCAGENTRKIAMQVFVAENVRGELKSDDYDFEWVDVDKALTMQMDGGDIYWVPCILRGSYVEASMKYDVTGALLTFKSIPKIIDHSLGLDRR